MNLSEKMTKVSEFPISAYRLKKQDSKTRIKNKKIKKLKTKTEKPLQTLIKSSNLSSETKNKNSKKIFSIKSNNNLVTEIKNVELTKPSKRLSLNLTSEPDKCIKNKSTKNQSIRYSTQIVDEKSSILFLQENEKVSLKGIGIVQCLVGTCFINGFKLNTHRYPVYSISSSYTIEAGSSPGLTIIELEHLLKKFNFSEKLILDLLKITKHSTTSFALILLDEVSKIILSNLIHYKNYNKSFCSNNGLKVFKETEISFNEHHFKVLQHWINNLKNKKERLIVVGEKNTGKSSFIRYLINQSLEHSPCIAYLECDPGQTEFAAPGNVALSLIRSPLLGPPFTHASVPEYSCFTSFVTPVSHPHYYIKCIKLVLKKYLKDHASIPLVVNTMGWLQGKGLQVVSSIISHVKATMVVQLYDGKFKSFSPYINKCKLQDEATEPFNFIHFPIQISFNSKRCSDGKPPPAYLRNLKLVSNLQNSSEQPSNNICVDHMLKTPVYCIQGLDVKACFGNYCDLTASVVSLCSPSQEEKEDMVCQSLGMGVVHGVSGDSIYLTTNLPLPILSKVTCLLVGSVKIPIEMLDGEEMRPVNRVSVNYQKDVFGSTSFKALRKFIPRKK